MAGNAAYAGPDIIALDTVNYSGKNVFSQGGVGRGGIDIYAPDTATIFASLVTIDPSPADGDEVQAGAARRQWRAGANGRDQVRR